MSRGNTTAEQHHQQQQQPFLVSVRTRDDERRRLSDDIVVDIILKKPSYSFLGCSSEAWEHLPESTVDPSDAEEEEEGEELVAVKSMAEGNSVIGHTSTAASGCGAGESDTRGEKTMEKAEEAEEGESAKDPVVSCPPNATDPSSCNNQSAAAVTTCSSDELQHQPAPVAEPATDAGSVQHDKGGLPVTIVQMQLQQESNSNEEEQQQQLIYNNSMQSAPFDSRQYHHEQCSTTSSNSASRNQQPIEYHDRQRQHHQPDGEAVTSFGTAATSGSAVQDCRNPNVKLGGGDGINPHPQQHQQQTQQTQQPTIYRQQLLTIDGATVTHSEDDDDTTSPKHGAGGHLYRHHHQQHHDRNPADIRNVRKEFQKGRNQVTRSCDAEAMAVIEQLDKSLTEVLIESNTKGCFSTTTSAGEAMNLQQDNLVEEIYVAQINRRRKSEPIPVITVDQFVDQKQQQQEFSSNKLRQSTGTTSVADAETNTDFEDVFQEITHDLTPVKLRENRNRIKEEKNRVFRISWKSLLNDPSSDPSNNTKTVNTGAREKQQVGGIGTASLSSPLRRGGNTANNYGIAASTNTAEQNKKNSWNSAQQQQKHQHHHRLYRERPVDIGELERKGNNKSYPLAAADKMYPPALVTGGETKETSTRVEITRRPQIINATVKDKKEILNNQQTTFNGNKPAINKQVDVDNLPLPSPPPPPHSAVSVVNVDIHQDSGSNLEGAVVASHSSNVNGADPRLATHHQGHFVVVAIDFGTTFSGYAFSFTRDPENIHMMRKWEGGDPGVINQKTPTCLLLTPDGEFHSFGFTARDYFHDLDAQEAKQWLYFDKFKMTLHHDTTLNRETKLQAANGKTMPALTVFAFALRYFKNHALMELSDQSATKILNEDVRWVITVPAIWRQPAKQFMRQAAYEAGIASPEYPDQLLIALEPEAASIYCRKLRMNQLVPEGPGLGRFSLIPPKPETSENAVPAIQEIDRGTRYIVVDCGGGTVDITVHEMADRSGSLKELYKATGGPYGSVGVDLEFEQLLNDIFTKDFIEQFKHKRPAAFVDLMIAFEARKRSASPYKSNPLNISLPFSFIEYYRKCKGGSVEAALRKYGRRDIRWSSQGMLRLEPEAMAHLFHPIIQHIVGHINGVVSNIESASIRYLFLVGGFAESQILQHHVRQMFGSRFRVIIPQGVSLAILRGAVLFGLDPTIVCVRRSRMTYGVGVLNRFIPGAHPKEKCIRRDGQDWCTDVFDKFVFTDQSVGLGDTILRSYTPANSGQKQIILHIYCSENDQVKFVTDPGVRQCGTLHLDISESQYVSLPKRREIQMRMIFGDTEIKVSALDVITQKFVRAEIDFLNL